MNRMCGIFIILCATTLSTRALASMSAQLRSGLVFESNSFYNDTSEDADLALVLEPSGQFQKQLGGSYLLTGKGLLLYSKYASLTEQDYFEYDLQMGNLLSLSQKWSIYLNPNTKLESEPAINKSKDRLERQYVGGDAGLIYQKDERRQWKLNVTYTQETLNQSRYEYLNNQDVRGLLTYRRYFLPETFAAFVFRSGVKNYPDGEKFAADGFSKYGSTRMEPGFAIVGRLTRYFKVKTYAGFVFLSYEKEKGFREPVFLLEFEEQLSPRDSIIIGYDYSVEDAYYGNYALLQKMYMGYGRFFGDQVLLTTNLEYLYRFFSEPYLRNDQRFLVVAKAEYSYTDKLKFELMATYDLNSSDSYNNLPAPPNPISLDPSVSYESYQLGIFLKYLL